MTGAAKLIDANPLVGGSFTTTGAANDNSRAWGTDGSTTYLYTPDGIHGNSRGYATAAPAVQRSVVPGL